MSPKGRNRIQIKWVMTYIKNTMSNLNDTMKAMTFLQDLVGIKDAGEVILEDSNIIAVSWNAGISIHLHTNNKTERWFRVLQEETPDVVHLHRRALSVQTGTFGLSQSFNFDYNGYYITLTFSA